MTRLLFLCFYVPFIAEAMLWDREVSFASLKSTMVEQRINNELLYRIIPSFVFCILQLLFVIFSMGDLISG